MSLLRKLKTAFIFAVFLAVVFSLSALPATAQDDSPFRFGFEAQGRYLSEADVEDGPGAFSVSGGGGSFIFGYKSNEFRLSYGLESYDWSDRASLPFGDGVSDPWSELHTVGISGRHFGRINDKWNYFAGGGLDWMYEDDMGEPGVRAYAGAGYALTPRLRVSLGAIFIYAPDVKLYILPLAGVVYSPAGEGPGGPQAQGLRVALGFPESAVSYRFNPMLALRLSAALDAGIYQLADDSPASPDGYLEKWGFGTGLFLDVSPVRNLTVSVGGQYLFGRELNLYEDDGDEIDSYDVDPAAAAVVKVKMTF